MAQTLINIDYTGLACRGIYYVGDDIETVKIGTFRGKDIFGITKENAPKGTLHKFVIRQTVTIEGIGKKTAKETIKKSGISFYKALQYAILQREPMRDRIKNNLLGVTDDEADQNRNATITVDELWEEYSDYKENIAKKKPWSGSYAYTMESDYRRLVKPYIGKMRAMSVRKEHVQNCVNEAINKGLKPRSEYSIVSVVKPMYDRWIENKELDKKNPARRLELNDLDNEVEVKLTWDQIEKLYTTLYRWKDERYRQFFIWLSTGRRNGEALMLDTANIDGKYYTIIAENNKAKKDMIYRVPDGINIHRFKDYVPPKPHKDYKHKIPTQQFVHTSPNNKYIHLQPVTVNVIWRNVRKKAGLPNIRKHDLRHIITTKLKSGGAPLEIRAMVLGHTMSDVTERYNTDAKEGADLKHLAVTFFLKKVFNEIDRDMYWDEYIIKK